ncbi:MAG TPA: pilus assembly protein TadE [Microlunatus sp.]|nr:pilus assembly protein TadE [Microlunatus sp.]
MTRANRTVPRDERGQSVSLLAMIVMAALILTAGLVVDGGQKLDASVRAEAAAAGAARAAGNAAATQELAGQESAGAAVLAAKAYLAGEPGVIGHVTVDSGVVRVRAESSAATLFLSVIGLDHVSGTGSAESDIIPIGPHR